MAPRSGSRVQPAKCLTPHQATEKPKQQPLGREKRAGQPRHLMRGWVKMSLGRKAAGPHRPASAEEPATTPTHLALWAMGTGERRTFPRGTVFG